MSEVRTPTFSLKVVSLFVALSTFFFVIEAPTCYAIVSASQRFTTDFSAAYLERRLNEIDRTRPDAVFLGDSVLWGFREFPGDTAVSVLRRRGCTCVNLAFKSGGPPNTYVLAALLARQPGRPAAAVIEVNQRTTNRHDPSYRTLVPAVAAAGASVLTAVDRQRLSAGVPVAETPVAAALTRVFPIFALRSDLRETVGGDDDSAPAAGAQPRLDPDDFEGTYDISPLTADNVGVRYLRSAVETLRTAGVRVIAFTTPTNHALLHEYLDDPVYAANDALLARTLRSAGATVVDLDTRFSRGEFIDNDHLNAAGQRHLADALQPAIDAAKRSAGA